MLLNINLITKNMERSLNMMSFLLFLLLLLPSLHLSAPVHPNHCYRDDHKVLLEIKKYFNSAASSFSTWTPGTDCCRWGGISCKKIPKTTTYRVNFVEIQYDLDIVGMIPPIIGELPYLQSLLIRGNPNVTGPIPPAITKLKDLGFVNLNSNNLTGPIPNFLNKLTKLLTFEALGNRLTGPIPSSLGQIPNLNALDFSDNQLTGTIPASLGYAKGLKFLTLSNNKLSGPIPRSLGNLNFEILELTGNRFTGDASFLFGINKTNLAHMNLASNQLSFDMTNVVMPEGIINSSLLILNVSHNLIYGRLPGWLAESPQLYSFDVSYNKLCGPIPTGGKLQEFDPSAFEHNKCLCGAPLPPCKKI